MIPNCKAHLAPLLVDPLVLHVFPVAVAQSCVVSQGQDPGSLQTLGQGVAVVAGQTVDDARVAWPADKDFHSFITETQECRNQK